MVIGRQVSAKEVRKEQQSAYLGLIGLSRETRTGWNEFGELCVFILPGGLGVRSREMTSEKGRSPG